MLSLERRGRYHNVIQGLSSGICTKIELLPSGYNSSHTVSNTLSSSKKR